jgi:hypothetical protein
MKGNIMTLNRELMIEALIDHAKGHIAKHRMNVEVYLTNPVGVGEHPDIMEAIEKELMEVAKYHDIVEMLHEYF